MKKVAEKIKTAVKSGNVTFNGSAIESVAAVLASPKPHERSEQEKAYDAIVKSVIVKKGRHRQLKPSAQIVKHGGVRLYTITTIASSVRYGGTRTVVVCSTFRRAKEIVETNEGDIYEYSYRLAVIEATVADWLYGGFTNEQYWYVWEGTSEDGSYVPIERPKAYENISNFGIG